MAQQNRLPRPYRVWISEGQFEGEQESTTQYVSLLCNIFDTKTLVVRVVEPWELWDDIGDNDDNYFVALRSIPNRSEVHGTICTRISLFLWMKGEGISMTALLYTHIDYHVHIGCESVKGSLKESRNQQHSMCPSYATYSTPKLSSFVS